MRAFNVSCRIIGVWLLLVVAAGASGSSAEGETVELWSYYFSPPFSIAEDGQDITSFLAAECTRFSEGRWTFEARSLPRSRLNAYLQEGQQGVVVWANPIWFGDRDETLYHWTERVVRGRNEIVSLASQPVEYEGPESLIGKSFGGVRGHHYVGIDELVEAGRLERHDVDSFKQNLRKLLKNRIDVTLIPKEELFLLKQQMSFDKEIHISSLPHQEYDRKFLVTPGLSGVREHINACLDQLRTDPRWLSRLKSVGLEP